MPWLAFMLLTGLSVLPAPASRGPRVVRVGMYQNPPKIFLDHQSRPQGIFVDILEDIARNQGWRIEYQPGTWSELLARLQTGKLDILPDVAHSSRRENRLFLGRTWVLESWVDVFSPEHRRIRSLSELDGRRIAVLADSVQEEFFSGELQTMGIHVRLLSLPDYGSMVRAVLDDRADALAASRFFYFSNERPSHLVPNHLVIGPGGLYFAFCRPGCEDLADIVDSAVARMKDDPASVWYASQARWLDQTVEKTSGNLRTLKMLGMILAISVAILAVFVILLRVQVRRRTHQLEQANFCLARMNRELEDTLDELRRSRAEKEQLDREIERIRRLETLGQLAGGIAHDFNNQLMAIQGLSEMVLGELPADVPAAQDVQAILETTRRGMDLTRQVLAFARRQPSHPQPMDVNVEVNSLFRMLRQLVGSRISMRFNAGENLPPIWMDPSQFEQVLTNLVINARDAIAESGTIEIATSLSSCENEEKPQERRACVRVEVTDDGCGIPPDILDRIFEPFFTTKKEGKGTGLGLSTVFGIVRRHGGFIRVRSRPGQTTFSLDFPITESPGPDSAGK